MKINYLISILLICTLNLSGQFIFIENLNITPTDSAAIDVNLMTLHGYNNSYSNHETSIINDTIYLNVCYHLGISGVITTIYVTIPIELEVDPNQYVLNLTTILSLSGEVCDPYAYGDSAIMAFSTPVTDSLFLSVPTIESNLSNLVTIYPNPAHDILHIQSNRLKIWSLTLYTPSGIKVKSQHENIQELILSDLSKGVYILKINTEQGMITKKFI